MDFSKTLIRASAMHNLMKTPQNKADKEAGNLSQSAKTYLQKTYRELTTGRVENVTSKYFEHGHFGEEYAITMLALKIKRNIKKNAERIYNDFFSGEPDTYLGESIYKATQGYDTKCPYSVFTMPFVSDEITDEYYWQDMTYMALTGAKTWSTVYCLVNHSIESVTRQKQSMWHKLNCDQKGVTPEYLKEAIEIEKNCIYNQAEFLKLYPYYDFDCKDWQYDLPMNQRIRLFPVERDEQAIELMQSKVIKAREYLQELHETEGEQTPIQVHDNVNGNNVVIHDTIGA